MADERTISVDQADASLAELVRGVSQSGRRAELVDAAGDEYVLLPKEELDGLEEALAILSDTPAIVALSDQLGRVARAAGEQTSLAAR